MLLPGERHKLLKGHDLPGHEVDIYEVFWFSPIEKGSELVTGNISEAIYLNAKFGLVTGWF